jgi:hypothetical protein
MIENFEKAFEFLMKYEGYKSNHKNDPGGRTIYGISEKYHPIVVNELWDLQPSIAKKNAKEFYKREYWDKVDGDDLPDKIDILVFDIFVNPGWKLFNYIEKKYPVYEMWPPHVIARLTLDRIKYYNDRCKANPKMKVFLHGWLNRCFDLMEVLDE